MNLGYCATKTSAQVIPLIHGSQHHENQLVISPLTQEAPLLAGLQVNLKTLISVYGNLANVPTRVCYDRQQVGAFRQVEVQVFLELLR